MLWGKRKVMEAGQGHPRVPKEPRPGEKHLLSLPKLHHMRPVEPCIINMSHANPNRQLMVPIKGDLFVAGLITGSKLNVTARKRGLTFQRDRYFEEKLQAQKGWSTVN